MSKVLVITTSLRAKSNSDRLAEELIKGAKDAGHDVEHISLKGKNIKFCIGCLARISADSTSPQEHKKKRRTTRCSMQLSAIG